MVLSRSTMATVWNGSQSKSTTEEVAWLATESIVSPLSCKNRYDNSQLCSTFHFLCIPYRYTIVLVHTSLQIFHYNPPALHRAPLDEVWCRRHCDLVGTPFFLLSPRIHPRIFLRSSCSILIRLRCLVRWNREAILQTSNIATHRTSSSRLYIFLIFRPTFTLPCSSELHCRFFK